MNLVAWSKEAVLLREPLCSLVTSLVKLIGPCLERCLSSYVEILAVLIGLYVDAACVEPKIDCLVAFPIMEEYRLALRR